MNRDRRPPSPFEDQYMNSRGQSYRPGAARERSPPRDAYRARSPPRRVEYTDAYRAPRPRSRSAPRRDEYRRRSPSPPRYREPQRDVRGVGDSYRGLRPRSPPRREDLPRDDLFRREAPRDYDRERAYGARSPPPRYRERSPMPLKRSREPSPVAHWGMRSPPLKRERLASPSRGRYEGPPVSRPVSPPRRRYAPEARERRPSPPRGMPQDYALQPRSPPVRSERVDPRAIDDWRRPRSPSPQRHARQEYFPDDNGRHSNATSRRSSPPVHPSRMVLQQQQQPADDRTGRPLATREPFEAREAYRARSPEPRHRVSPMPKEWEYANDRGYVNGDVSVTPPREPHHADDVVPGRAPPAAGAGGGSRGPATPMAPPTGPAAGGVSVSAHTRAPAIPPSGPRATGVQNAPRGRGGFGGDFGPRGGRGGISVSFRGGRGGGAPGVGRGDGFHREPSLGAGSASYPGSRGSFPSAPRPEFIQSNNTTATTYPRSQRFAPNGQPIPDPPNKPSSVGPPTGPKAQRRPAESAVDRRPAAPHAALADLAKPIEGGQRMEPLVDTSRLIKLQEEAEKLRKQIEEREARKRKVSHDWDRLARETEVAALKSELAEQAVRGLNGEAESTAAF